ncbi:hypothetical protein BJ138DRAFT_1020827, partial [Hygrophoropsis aurantiaca]
NSDNNDSEEALFTVQGVIADLDLPPLKTRPRGNQARHMRQSVVLSGLGLPAFEDAITTLYGIHTLLGRNVPPGALEKWQPFDYIGTRAIEIQNRYFTVKRFGNGLPKLPFDLLCDSNGYLEDCSTPEMYHTEDNEVDYYSSADTGYRATKISPSAFRAGDLVEACLSVITSPISADKYKMLVVLRSLALIDSTHTMVSEPSDRTQRGTNPIRKNGSAIQTVTYLYVQI